MKRPVTRLVRAAFVFTAFVSLVGVAACSHGRRVSPAPAPFAASIAPSAAPPANSAAKAARRLEYPPTARSEVIEAVHGIAVRDPYRWLEDEKSPDVTKWASAQDAFARARLAELPGRNAIASRL